MQHVGCFAQMRVVDVNPAQGAAAGRPHGRREEGPTCSSSPRYGTYCALRLPRTQVAFSGGTIPSFAQGSNTFLFLCKAFTIILNSGGLSGGTSPTSTRPAPPRCGTPVHSPLCPAQRSTACVLHSPCWLICPSYLCPPFPCRACADTHVCSLIMPWFAVQLWSRKELKKELRKGLPGLKEEIEAGAGIKEVAEEEGKGLGFKP